MPSAHPIVTTLPVPLPLSSLLSRIPPTHPPACPALLPQSPGSLGPDHFPRHQLRAPEHSVPTKSHQMVLDRLHDHPGFPKCLQLLLVQQWGPAHPGRMEPKMEANGEGVGRGWQEPRVCSLGSPPASFLCPPRPPGLHSPPCPSLLPWPVLPQAQLAS